MKITFTSNKSMTEFLKGNNKVLSFAEDVYLYNLFSQRGHDVSYVHPSDILVSNEDVYFKSEWKLNGGTGIYDRQLDGVSPVLENVDVSPTADVIFIRGLGEDESPEFQHNRTFFNSLYALEKQVPLMLNSAKTTNYEIKSEQKKLDLPYIDSWRVNSKTDLSEILKQESELILKPDIGFMGNGVQYISSQKDISFIADDILYNSSFEKVNHSKTETRYIVMNGDILFAREAIRTGNIGAEKSSNIYFKSDVDSKQRSIVNDAIKQTGLFYGSVDFRGDHLLEINGSGTSIGIAYSLYDLAPNLVRAVEKKFD